MRTDPCEIQRFIKDNSRPTAPFSVPEVVLYTAVESLPLWENAQAWIDRELPIPFWAFPWAGGQAVARFILDFPLWVAGKTVLDFGAGSGLVGIAAAKAGARRVICADIDPFAREAMLLNALQNKVSFEVITHDIVNTNLPGIDVVLAGDMFYEKGPAASFESWFRTLATDHNKVVIFGDPGRHYVPINQLHLLHTYDIRTTRELEDADVRRTNVFRM